MVWDEENRLRGINDNGRLHLYTYDHTGERALKSSAESSMAVINGLASAVITHTEDYTAYVSPYFVVQKGKFTKHYFEGVTRVVSKLGEGTFSHKNIGIMAGGLDYLKRTQKEQEARDRYIKGLNVPPGPPTQHGIYATPEWTKQPYPSIDWEAISQNQEPPAGWPRYPRFNEPGDVPGPPVQFGEAITNKTARAGFNFIPNGVEEKNLYFYHPDHLGSSSYITDKNGEVIQHTEYMAFGETFVDEHSVSNKQPYLFNGKELDYETGLYYYGARYYDPKTSLWLNTDPLSGYNPILETEHYIDGQHNGGVHNPMNLNTYTYTYQNPVVYVDPNGKQNYFTHGTWAAPNTFERIKELNNIVNNTFNSNNRYITKQWSGYNSHDAREVAAKELVAHIIATMDKNPNVPINLVGHSHGGNVDILALNMMANMKEFEGRQINLLTINTPVRDDYQLSNKALARGVEHFNIYDLGDFVQTNGGNSFTIHIVQNEKEGLAPTGSVKYISGEFGSAGRTFKNATNIKTKKSNVIDFHNSHNRLDWTIPKKETKNE